MSRGLQPDSVRGQIREQFPEITDEDFKRLKGAVYASKRPLTVANVIDAMDREPKRTAAERVREILPTSYERAYEVLADIPRNGVYCAIRAMLASGRIMRLDSGMLVLGEEYVPNTKQSHRVTGLPSDEPSRSEPGKSTLWREVAELSPRVDCPARGVVTLSTCHDDYTDAASGHKRGPAECGRCVVGRQRRADLARSVCVP